MAQAAKVTHDPLTPSRLITSRLTPSPKALQKALEKSALQAQRLADAFGLKVPMAVQRSVAEKPQAVA